MLLGLMLLRVTSFLDALSGPRDEFQHSCVEPKVVQVKHVCRMGNGECSFLEGRTMLLPTRHPSLLELRGGSPVMGGEHVSKVLCTQTLCCCSFVSPCFCAAPGSCHWHGSDPCLSPSRHTSSILMPLQVPFTTQTRSSVGCPPLGGSCTSWGGGRMEGGDVSSRIQASQLGGLQRREAIRGLCCTVQRGSFP